ncbi:MAG TPA: hypothetical protein VN285_04950 [Candidatus Deferrimicrobium sp.]|nr:hypothetical protein [Candidatus Deferrimicrobium sp.]
MKRRNQLGRVLVLVLVALIGIAVSSESKQPSIEGTYKLVSRKLPDGTVKTAPDVIGLMTFTQTHRNFNVAWKDDQGKPMSFALIASYSLTDSSYTETVLYSLTNIEGSGKGATYSFGSQAKSAPVTVEGGKVRFMLPNEPIPIEAVFEGDKGTATSAGAFIDFWEKIK